MRKVPQILFALVASLVLLMFGAGCQRPDPVQEEIQHVRDRTMPSAARLVRTVATERTAWSVTASWEIETDESWKQYSDWVAERLGGDYVTAEASDSGRVLRRNLLGDVYVLQIEPTSTGSPLRVRARFIASPE